MSERDVSDEVELKNGKALPGGWSQYELWHEGQRIGWIESGYPKDAIPGYRFEEKPEGENRRLVVWKS